MSVQYWSWIIATAVMTVIAPICVRHYLSHPSAWYLLVVACLANLLLVGAYYVILQWSFLQSFTVAKLLSIVMLLVYGYAIFHERPIWRVNIGIVLAVVTIYLLR